MNRCVICGEPCASDNNRARYCAEHAPEKKVPTRPSMRAAINAFCKACIYDAHAGAGTWRQQVEACTAPDCSLYPFRPTPGPPPSAKGARVERPESDELP